MATLDRDAILKALTVVVDPDLRRDIVSLNFVKDVVVDGGRVGFTIELTTPACPVKDQMRDQAIAAVRALPGVSSVDVQLSEWTLPRTVAAFRVITDLSQFGSDSVVGATKSRGGFLAVAYDWRVQTAEGSRPLPGLQLPGARMAPR